MSKSDLSDNSRINFTDTADVIAKKIRKAKTDAGVIPESLKELEGRPEVDNLVGIYSAFTGLSKQGVLDKYAGQGFGVFKPALADLAVEVLRPITERMNDYLANPGETDKVLAKGAEAANKIAEPILARSQRNYGILETQMIRKVLIYPALFIFTVLGVMTVYYFTAIRRPCSRILPLKMSPCAYLRPVKPKAQLFLILSIMAARINFCPPAALLARMWNCTLICTKTA